MENTSSDTPTGASFVSPPTQAPVLDWPSTGNNENTSNGAVPPRMDVPAPAGYTLLEVLGRGGMGIVYKARQASLNRIVAIKMTLSGGHANEGELARFRVEAEAIARMQHPNIVQVFEVGTVSGLPYFTLEFCEGGSLNRKLAGVPLPPTEASNLVQKLALAMHAAHEKGVLHRDLKPGNVLLTGDGTPKITDFGLAKLDQQDLASASGVMGTPNYMAPEQAQGKNRTLTPACDLYSLGAVLYECLTGRPPFLSDSSVETLRQVVHDDPVPPRRLNPRVPRDLETICLKCLAKKEDRRYATALDLADDLRRFESGEAIEARPTGTIERAIRWVRRRPTQAALLGMIVLSVFLLAVTVVAFTKRLAEERDNALAAQNDAEAEKDRADEERDKAKAERDRADGERDNARAEARKVKEVRRLFTDMFTAADPVGVDSVVLSGLRDGSAPHTTRELVERASRHLETSPIRDPEVRAEMFDTLGDLHRSLGKLDQAEKYLLEGIKLRRECLSADHLDLATSLHHMGWLRHEQGRYEEAERLYQEALTIRSKRLPADSPEVSDGRLHLAWVATQADDLESAERQFRSLFERRQEKLGDDHRDTAIARMGLVAVYLHSERYVEVMFHLPYIKAYVKKNAAENKLDGAVEKLQDGVVFVHRKNYTQAIVRYREALTIVSRQLGPDHVYTALVLFQLALALDQSNQAVEADSTYRRCLAITREKVGLEHPKAIPLIEAFASFLVKQRKEAEAKALFVELVEAHRGRGDGRFLADALRARGQLFDSLNQTTEAITDYREALVIYRRTGGPCRQKFTACLNNLASLLNRADRSVEAEPLYQEVLPLVRKQYGPSHVNTAIVLTNLAGAWMDLDKLDGVEGHLLEAKRIHAPASGFGGIFQQPPHLLYFQTLTRLSEYYRRVDRIDSAAGAADEIGQRWPKDPARLYHAAREFARCAKATPKPESKRKYAERAVAILRLAEERKFRDAALLRTDEGDWDALKDHPALDGIRKKIREVVPPPP